MPLLLYGSENWIMTEALFVKLEAFQGELVKRVLKWPRYQHCCHHCLGCIYVPTMRGRLLVRKLGSCSGW